MNDSINYELLARVRDRIAEVGDEHCAMGSWTDGGVMVGSGEPKCGTTACIAGHTAAVQYGNAYGSLVVVNGFDRDVANEAARALRLPGGCFTPLFYVHEWPVRYQEILFTEGQAKGMIAILDALMLGTVVFRDVPYDGLQLVEVDEVDDIDPTTKGTTP